MTAVPTRTGRALDREILRLAGPAFLALVAEPLFLLVDAAVVGHLGTTSLAGLGVAGAVLQTLVGLCVFLAYGTTSGVARRVGAGDLRGAVAVGVDGVWLAVGLGSVVALAALAAVGPLVAFFGAGPAVSGQAVAYLRVALLGVVPLLVALAATGVLRGLQDTRTPLVVAVAANVANVVLNVLLVRGVAGWAGLGITGSALGSVVAQAGTAVALLVVVVRGARTQGARLAPDLRGVVAAARAGVALVVRTLTLRAALLLTALVVSAGGTAAQIAAHQLAMTLWGLLALALDAVAIAAQAVTGRALGAGDLAAARAVTARVVRWGLVSGVVTGVLLAAASPVLGPLFTGDHAVRDLLVPVLVVAAVGQPVAGVVFVLDGVLIGAGDGRYLAGAGLVVLAVYAPVALLTRGHGLVMVWVAFTSVFMGGRLLTLVRRRRQDAWLVAGPTMRG